MPCKHAHLAQLFCRLRVKWCPLPMHSLDTPDKVQPEAHIYHFSKLSFIKLDDGLPSFEGERAHMAQFR